MWYPMPILPSNWFGIDTGFHPYHRIGLASAALGHRMSQAYKMFFLYKWFHWSLYCQQRVNAYIILNVNVYNNGNKLEPDYVNLQLWCTNASSKVGWLNRSGLTFKIVLCCRGRPATFLQDSIGVFSHQTTFKNMNETSTLVAYVMLIQQHLQSVWCFCLTFFMGSCFFIFFTVL